MRTPTPTQTSKADVRRARGAFPFVLPVLVLAIACGESPTGATCDTDPTLCPEVPDTTAAYFAALPSWEAFAQPDTVKKNELNVAADTLPVEEVVLDTVPVFGSPTGDSIMTNVRYVCQARPYSISDAPERITMFDPSRANLYAGALIQGRSKKELGSLLPLRVSERNPVTVSIPDLPTGANSVIVDNPAQGTVESARGQMIGDAVAQDLFTPATTTFTMETYHSETQMALAANLSGSYLGFKANASGSLDRRLSETTVTAHFYQRMYTVVVEAPADGFFSDAFTNEVLARHIEEGTIGADNLPVYVSEIVYGRMMMFSVTSSASEDEIRTAMRASYNTFAGSAGVQLDSEKKEILERSKIAITAVGGSGQAAEAMIASGDWSTYFETSPKLSQAVPLSYTFTNVGDGSVAAVTEATEYNINECTPKPLIPGTFDFNVRQDLSAGLTPGYQTHFGDANGDGRSDMIFTYQSGSTSEVAVAFGQADGSFSVQAKQDATVTPAEGWSLFNQVAVGDVDGDGSDDLLWNRLDTENSFYVALSNGDGTFTWGARQERGDGGWGSYDVRIADLDNADGGDIVWHGVVPAVNRTYVAMSNGDGTFDLTQAPQDQIGTSNWSGTDFFIADVTGDGFVDLIHSRTNSSDNANWVSRSNGDGTFDMSDGAFTRYGGPGWADYKPVVGDIDGDQRADMAWVADARPDIAVHRAIAGANGTFAKKPWQHVPDSADGAGPYEIRIGDIDADGDADLVMVDLDSSNNNPVLTNRARIWVGLGTDDNLGERFDFTPVDQLHPESVAWGQFDVELADVNGDNKADLVIHWNSSPHQIYVALAK